MESVLNATCKGNPRAETGDKVPVVVKCDDDCLIAPANPLDRRRLTQAWCEIGYVHDPVMKGMERAPVTYADDRRAPRGRTQDAIEFGFRLLVQRRGGFVQKDYRRLAQ